MKLVRIGKFEVNEAWISHIEDKGQVINVYFGHGMSETLTGEEALHFRLSFSSKQDFVTKRFFSENACVHVLLEVRSAFETAIRNLRVYFPAFNFSETVEPSRFHVAREGRALTIRLDADRSEVHVSISKLFNFEKAVVYHCVSANSEQTELHLGNVDGRVIQAEQLVADAFTSFLW